MTGPSLNTNDQVCESGLESKNFLIKTKKCNAKQEIGTFYTSAKNKNGFVYLMIEGNDFEDLNPLSVFLFFARRCPCNVSRKELQSRGSEVGCMEARSRRSLKFSAKQVVFLVSSGKKQISPPGFFLRFRFGDRKEILRDRKYFIRDCQYFKL